MEHIVCVNVRSRDAPAGLMAIARVPMPAPGASKVTILACLQSRLSCAPSRSGIASDSNNVIALIEINIRDFMLSPFLLVEL